MYVCSARCNVVLVFSLSLSLSLRSPADTNVCLCIREGRGGRGFVCAYFTGYNWDIFLLFSVPPSPLLTLSLSCESNYGKIVIVENAFANVRTQEFPRENCLTAAIVII